MKKIAFLLILLISFRLNGYSQINKDQLALDVSNVDAENTDKLKAYSWKLHAEITGEGNSKTTLVNEMRYNDKGELMITVIGGQTNIKQKPGLRGKMQQNVLESKMEYVGNAIKLSLAYTYMSKGQLLDFYNKAVINEKDGILTAVGKNIFMEGDQLIIRIDAKTKFYLSKSFTAKLGENPLMGEIQYETFKSSGINHVSTMKLDLPSDKITISGENKDYLVKIN